MNILILIVGLVAGVPVLLSSFAEIPVITEVAQEFQRWGIILAGFSSFLGVMNLTHVNVSAVRRKKKLASTYDSFVLLVMLWLLIVVGVFFGQSHPIYDFVFQNALKPLSASGFAMLGFFIATAAYRAFRVRNVDAAILLVCGCIMMLANIPIGEMIWGGFPIVSEWIMKTLNGAAMKGIVIGSGIGAIATSVKVLIGLERSHLGG
ncbi:MAG TPA: hypothetical protein PLN81_11110 [Bacillota bacterium]|nr:hypothetical protein [Bacillota bacterium]